MISYLCWYHQARGAPCTPLCCRTVRTSFSRRCPSAVFPAYPQTASCLLRGRRSPGWEGRKQDNVWVMRVRSQRGEKSGSRCFMGEVIQAVKKRWGGGEGEVPCHRTCMNNREQQQCDKQLKSRVDVSLQCLRAPPECSNMNITTNKQHLAVTQMFVTLCVVREAAPSVPVCEGSDQCFCMF